MNRLKLRKVDTGFTDIAGTPILKGATVSNPQFERDNNCGPGIVKIDANGEYNVQCPSNEDPKSLKRIYNLDQDVASTILVIK